METFSEVKLLEEAARMTEWSRAVFMAGCCERMLPNYVIFNRDSGFGDLKPLRDALDAVWDWTKLDRPPENAADLVAACEKQAPNTAEFTSAYTSAALDATSAIAETVESIPYPTKEQVVEVASLARDTVDVFVQERDSLNPDDKDLERLIVESDLMQIELRAQREALESLNQLQGNDRNGAVAELQTRLFGPHGSLESA